MNLIDELRMLAEDLHVNGYNRYSAAMSKAADELGPLERYRTAYTEWIDKTEWVQADTSLPAKYLGMHRADVLKDMISELEERLKEAEKAVIEQARLNGIGREHEAALMAKLEAAKKSDAESTAMYRKAWGERDALCAEANTWRRLAESYWAKIEQMEKEIASLRADKATLQQMVYSLKDHLEAAEKERERDEERIADLMADLNRVGHENDALRAKVKQMEGQEPVWFIDERGEPKRYHKSKADYCKYGGLDLLYALPGAKGVPKC